MLLPISGTLGISCTNKMECSVCSFSCLTRLLEQIPGLLGITVRTVGVGGGCSHRLRVVFTCIPRCVHQTSPMYCYVYAMQLHEDDL